jgi:hypothetical protein
MLRRSAGRSFGGKKPGVRSLRAARGRKFVFKIHDSMLSAAPLSQRASDDQRAIGYDDMTN